MLRSLLQNGYRRAQHASYRITSSNIHKRPSSIPNYRTFTATHCIKMPSEKADPTTATLPAEQANPAAPAPKIGAEAAEGAAAEGGDVGEDGKPSKKGGKLERTARTT